MRLQILELPTKHVGDEMTTPFILVMSEAPPITDAAQVERIRAEYAQLKVNCGAAAFLVTNEPVEIGPPPTAEPEEDATRILQERYGVRA